MAQMETCGGAIHHLKLNALVSGKLLNSLLFRGVEFRFDGSLLSSLSYFSPAVLHCVCVGPTVSPLSDFAHYGLCAHTQHAPVFFKQTIA